MRMEFAGYLLLLTGCSSCKCAAYMVTCKSFEKKKKKRRR